MIGTDPQIVEHFGTNKVIVDMRFKDVEDVRKLMAGAFSHITGGMPSQVWGEKTRKEFESALRRNWPLIRKSSLRMFIEGHLTPDEDGKPSAPFHVPFQVQKRLELIMCFADVLATMRVEQFGDKLELPKKPETTAAAPSVTTPKKAPRSRVSAPAKGKQS